jgi:hypothetical protein
MPVALSIGEVAQTNPETAGAKELLAKKQITVKRDEKLASGLRILEGKAADKLVELLLDGDGRMLRGKCSCSHHFTGGLRRGPCRHLQALRTAAYEGVSSQSLDQWFEQYWN